MHDSELRRVDRELRGLLAGTDLQWVLDEVDEAIADGVSEERILHHRRGKGRRGGERREEDLRVAASEDYTVARAEGGELEASRRGGALVITTRPMTLRERVLLLLEAVRRVVIELPEIEEETLMVLRRTPADEELRAPVETVAFEPEEEQRRRSDRPTMLTERMSQFIRGRASMLFAQVREEVKNE